MAETDRQTKKVECAWLLLLSNASGLPASSYRSNSSAPTLRLQLTASTPRPPTSPPPPASLAHQLADNVLTRAVAGWHERRSCCQLTAAASQHASSSMCLLSLRRLSRLLVAASNQGSQPPSLGRVLPGCPKPRPPSSSRHHTSPTPRATPTVASTPTSLTLVRRRPAVRRKPLNKNTTIYF